MNPASSFIGDRTYRSYMTYGTYSQDNTISITFANSVVNNPRTGTGPRGLSPRSNRPVYLGNNSATNDLSSANSFTLASILNRLNSLIGRSLKISQAVPLLRIGN